MIKRLKFIKKSTWVIAALFVLNVIAFLAVSSGIQYSQSTTDTITTNADNNNYFKTGVNVLDWSYTLLRYFNK